MHVSPFGANGGRIHNAIPVYVSQSEFNESTWICWHQDRSSTEFGIDVSWIHPKLDDECLASLSSLQLWYGFLGHSNSLEEVVHKLHLSRTLTKKKSQGVRSGYLGDQNISAKSSFPTRPIHSWGGDLLGNVEHSDANGVELRLAGKCNLLELHVSWTNLYLNDG